VGYNFVVDN